jgi:hypothetical protein
MKTRLQGLSAINATDTASFTSSTSRPETKCSLTMQSTLTVNNATRR